MKSRTRLQSYRALMKDQLITNKPNLKKNITLAMIDKQRIFGKEVINILNNKENINNINLNNEGKRIVSRSLVYQKQRPKSIKSKQVILNQYNPTPVQTKTNLVIPQHVGEYYHQIIFHLMKITMLTPRIDHTYMNFQKELKSQNREELVSQLIQIHLKFKLLPTTLFKTINLLDNYLSQNSNLQKRKLQLLGLSCLFIASKYEEIYPPSMRHYVDACAKRFSNFQIIDMQSKILKHNDFNICNNSTSQFINTLALQFSFSQKQRYLCMYLAQLSLYSMEMTQYYPIQIALSCGVIVCSSMKSQILSVFDRQDDKHITNCSQQLLKLFKQCSNTSISSITKKKYSKQQYLQVGKISNIDN